MADWSNNPKKIKYLTLVWVRKASDRIATPKAPEAAHPQTDGPAEAVSKDGIADLLETMLEDCSLPSMSRDLHGELPAAPTHPGSDDFADYSDGYFDTVDDFDPEQVEKVRLQFKTIDSTEELSQAFLDGDWWVAPALHDELRRACSGSGELSRLLARRAGFEFIVGLAQSLAYRGDGPLSTPLTFKSEFPEEPTWNEEVITLNAPYRQDAVELSGYLSFKMH